MSLFGFSFFGGVDTSKIKRKKLDVPYKTESNYQKLDIYYPNEGKGPYPAIIFIHGGGWQMCDKGDFEIEPFLSVLDDGFALISINYRLSKDGPFPLGFNDCLDAVNYIVDQAEELDIDPDRLGIAGESAGANYALLLLEKDIPVKAALSWYCPTDFKHFNEEHDLNHVPHFSNDDPNSFEAKHLGTSICEASQELLEKVSPIYQIKDSFPPILLEHGLNDHHVPYQQSLTYYEKAKDIVGEDKVELKLIEGADHCDPIFKSDENMRIVRDFFNKNI